MFDLHIFTTFKIKPLHCCFYNFGKTNFCPNCGADMRADRYDSLQFAIKLTIKRYKKQIKENTEVIDRHSDPVSFCAIRVGEISALKQAIEDMEKWV